MSQIRHLKSILSSSHHHLYQYSNTSLAMHKYTFSHMRSMVENNAVNDARNPHLGGTGACIPVINVVWILPIIAFFVASNKVSMF